MWQVRLAKLGYVVKIRVGRSTNPSKTSMNQNAERSQAKGIWLASDEVHELRDQIQALKVGQSLLINSSNLSTDDVGEIVREMGEAISKLSQSSLFHPTSSVADGP